MLKGCVVKCEVEKGHNWMNSIEKVISKRDPLSDFVKKRINEKVDKFELRLEASG